MVIFAGVSVMLAAVPDPGGQDAGRLLAVSAYRRCVELAGNPGWCSSAVWGTGKLASIWASQRLTWRRCCEPLSVRPRPQNQAACPAPVRTGHGRDGGASRPGLGQPAAQREFRFCLFRQLC
jgi:hypothetical protein